MSSIEWLELDYTKMIANPMVVPVKKSPRDYYDLFKKYKEFDAELKDVDERKLFRYIPLVYDKNSPLHAVIDDFKKLKAKAAELAGFLKNSEQKFLKPVEEILSCNNRDVNFMIVRYVIHHKSAKYHEMVILKEAHLKISAKVLEDPSAKELASFKTVGAQVDEIQQELLSGDNNPKLQENLLEYYFEDKLELRPEDIARRRAAGLPLV